MRLRKLILRNWRSFLGKAEIRFASDAKKNVTVLVGQNGAGKTALLNAFTWVLFQETTAGFRRPGDLFNHAALNAIQHGASETMEVILEFDHEGSSYNIRRSQEATRDSESDEPVLGEVQFTARKRSAGATEAIDQTQIEAILPRRLHSFFFFPAENIGKEFDKDDAAAIRANMAGAIDVLLGIDVYDRALDVISKSLSQHLKTPRGASTHALEEADEAMKKAREEWEKINKRKRELPDLITNAEILEDTLKDLIDGMAAYRTAMDEISSIRVNLKAAQEESATTKEEQREIANVYSCVIFGDELFSKAFQVLDDAHRRGEIPPKVSAGLLQELIEHREVCICGNTIGDAERARLEQIRAKTVEDQIVQQASDLRGRLPSLFRKGDVSFAQFAAEEFLKQVRRSATADADVRALKNQEKGVLESQPELSHADPDKTLDAWKQAAKSTLRLKQEFEKVNEDLPRIEIKKREAEKQHQIQLKKNTTTRTVGRAREYLSNVENALTQIQDIIRQSARKDVQRAMNLFFQPLLLKNYRITLTDEFKFEVVDEATGRPVGASSSEIALATFAFVGAIAALMPPYANLESLIPSADAHSPGGVDADLQEAYPVVLDAPFSPFGEEYAERFSGKLPELLPQSVVVVREDQIRYLKPIFDERRIGEAYMLRMHSAKEGSKRISWLNTNVDYVIKTADDEAPHSEVLSLPVE